MALSLSGFVRPRIPLKVGGLKMGKFVPNPVGIAKLRATPAMIESMRQRAEAAADAAVQAWYASGPHPYETGDYVNSIKGEVGVEDGRAVGRVNAYDFKSWWIEYGTIHMRAFAPLVRGAEAIGLHVKAERGWRR